MSTESKIAFKGTAEQEKQLMAVIDEYKEQRGSLIPVLHKAQEIYGYLPIEVQKMVAEGLNVPLADVYGVVTFYAQFSLNPKGEYKIGVCLGTACYVKGSGDIIQKVKDITGIDVDECTPDGKFSLEATRCIGACGLAPVMTINDDVYGRLEVKDVEGILKKYS